MIQLLGVVNLADALCSARGRYRAALSRKRDYRARAFERSIRLTISWLLILVAGLTLSSDAHAAEGRCDELGEHCVCSEPLNGNLRRIGSSWYNPDDSESKECTVENFSDPALRGAALTRNTDDLRPASDSFILGALPAGHRLRSVIRAPAGYSGLWFLGHYFRDDRKFVRRPAGRWY